MGISIYSRWTSTIKKSAGLVNWAARSISVIRKRNRKMDSQESQGRDDRPVDFEAVMNRLASARRELLDLSTRNRLRIPMK